ncbi:MAG: hypothetical protein ABI664_18945 [bacterium]
MAPEPGHRIESDGSVVLAFACTSLVPVVSWVLEWGLHARVLELPS